MRPITIVGGGLAGLTLGIGLRQRDVPVTVWEAGRYPRHRVCGEFINGRGVESLKRLGLLDLLKQSGIIIAKTTAFHAGKFSSGLKTLPTSALCISRWTLDATLAREFRRLGGDLREQERWRENGMDEFLIHASGRRAQPIENGWRWLGVKAHARNVSLQADLEMFLNRDSYVGVSKLPGGEVNVCGLFRRRVGESSPAASAREWFDEASFCSVAGLSLRPIRAAASVECRVGDAITMIPPLTGNGMSMAFESAEIAMEPLAACSRGEFSWTQTQRQIARECDIRFTRRLRWASWLQALALLPPGRGAMLWFVAHSDWFWRMWFRLTR